VFASSPFPLNAGGVGKPRQPSVVRALILLLALPAAIFAGILVYAHVTAPTKAALAPAPPSYHGHLVWADGKVVFAHRKEVAAWLRQHGGRYPVFTKRHPVATKLVTPIKRRLVAKHTPARPARHKPAARQQPTRVAAPPTGGPTSRWAGLGARDVAIVLAIAGLLLLFSVAPPAVLRKLGLSRLIRDRDFRYGAAGAGLAFVAGVAVVSLLA
jgi:hypothetical protein